MKQNAPFHGQFRPHWETQPEPDLPHDIEVEQALLGALLVWNDTYLNISDFFKADHFYDPLHAKIYREIEDCIAQDVEANPITIGRKFENIEINPGLNAKQYLARLCTNVIGPNAESYARIIQNLAKRREMIVLGNELVQTASESGSAIDPNEIIEEISESLYALADHGVSRTKPISIEDAAQNVLERVRSGEKPNCVPTGLKDLDRMIGGYFRGEFTIIAARPGMGKSAFVSSTMRRIADEGHGVAMFSLEMTKDQIGERILSDIAYSGENSIAYDRIRQNDVQPYELEKLESAARRLENLPIIIDETRGLTIAQLTTRARKMAGDFAKHGRKLDVLFVDHLGLMKPSDHYRGSKTNETGEISNALACLAKDLDIAVVGLSQLNRGVEGRDSKLPTLADLRNSGDLEQDANTVAFLYRAEYYLEREEPESDQEKEKIRQEALEKCRNSMTISVAKNRSGETGIVKVMAFMASNAIRDRA